MNNKVSSVTEKQWPAHWLQLVGVVSKPSKTDKLKTATVTFKIRHHKLVYDLGDSVHGVINIY